MNTFNLGWLKKNFWVLSISPFSVLSQSERDRDKEQLTHPKKKEKKKKLFTVKKPHTNLILAQKYTRKTS